MDCRVGVLLLILTCCAAQTNNVEQQFIQAIDTIDTDQSVYLFGGCSIEKVNKGRSVQPAAENALERLGQYLQTHELSWEFPSEDYESQARSASSAEPRTRRLKKILLPLLLALKLKMGIIIPLIFMVIKFISFKALGIGLLALLFAGGSLLKDLLAKKKDHVTTAYISGTPLNAEIVHTDWNRNGQASAQELAYGYHTIPQPAF